VSELPLTNLINKDLALVGLEEKRLVSQFAKKEHKYTALQASTGPQALNPVALVTVGKCRPALLPNI
jgi:hypothetical protein